MQTLLMWTVNRKNFIQLWLSCVCMQACVCVFVWAQQNLHSQALRIPTNLKHINSIGLIRTSNAQRKKQE